MVNLKTLRKQFLSSFVLSLSAIAIAISPAGADSPDTAPSELKNTISQIEAAANSHNIDAVMAFYSSNFTNTDGLNTTTLATALKKTWEEYPKLAYSTELVAWEKQGDRLVAETVVKIQGTHQSEDRLLQFMSTMRSRQFFENNKIVKQEILSESTQISSGDNPPDVEVNVPEKVRRGQKYSFDVIVNTPLNDDVLLGAAIEEKINGDRYLNPSKINLQVLAAGGIYKNVIAPIGGSNHWLSAILVRGDGITLVTRRVIVE